MSAVPKCGAIRETLARADYREIARQLRAIGRLWEGPPLSVDCFDGETPTAFVENCAEEVGASFAQSTRLESNHTFIVMFYAPAYSNIICV